MAAVDPAQSTRVGIRGSEHRGQEQGHIERLNRLVGHPRGFCRPAPARRARANAPSPATRAPRPSRPCRSRQQRTSHKPSALAGVVEEIAADVIAGEHAPGYLGPIDLAASPWWQQVCWDSAAGWRSCADGRHGARRCTRTRAPAPTRPAPRTAEISRRSVASERKPMIRSRTTIGQSVLGPTWSNTSPCSCGSASGTISADADRRTVSARETASHPRRGAGARPVYIQTRTAADRAARL